MSTLKGDTCLNVARAGGLALILAAALGAANAKGLGHPPGPVTPDFAKPANTTANKDSLPDKGVTAQILSAERGLLRD